MREMYRVGINLITASLEKGEVNMTVLAENIAHCLDHGEWLDDPDNEVWTVALELRERYQETRMSAV